MSTTARTPPSGAPSDQIRLTGLEADAVIGIHAWERRVRQRLRFDLTMPTDAARGARSDAIEDALDYTAVAARVRSHCAASDCLLVETLADRLAGDLLSHFGLPWLRLTLHKTGAIDGCADVILDIERTREPDGRTPDGRTAE
ncbi:MAG TPA: dihydroneopterin aldolase [Pseudomonadales bacterium]|nr:dihydroneopterin aldolase [Pseudomonadales bacterium]